MEVFSLLWKCRCDWLNLPSALNLLLPQIISDIVRSTNVWMCARVYACVCVCEESFKQFAIISIASSPPPSIINKVTHPRRPLNAHFDAAPDSRVRDLWPFFFSILVLPKMRKKNSRYPTMKIHGVETELCRGDAAPLCCNFLFAFIYGALSGPRQRAASLSQRLRQSGYAPWWDFIMLGMLCFLMNILKLLLCKQSF